MTKLENRRQVNTFTLLLMCTYMISYITRINYGAIISEMETATSISRELLSVALTGSFITYGAGQMVSGVLGDRFSPKKLVSYGLVATVLMNLMIPVCQDACQMLVVWCVNGFAQSFMWPPMVKLMTALLSKTDYKKTSEKVSWGSSIGSIVVYLFAPILISVFGWKSVFLFSAVCGIIMIFVWNRFSYDIEIEQKQPDAAPGKIKGGFLFQPLMICIMVAIVLQGMLRDGVTTWMPSYISETYHLSHVISILTGVILPIFGIVCFHLATKLHMKKFTNPLMCAGVFFGAGALSSLGLVLLAGVNAGFSVLLSAMLTGCMHGVNLMLVCMIPPFFEKYGSVSTVSGVINACTYIGSAVSTYGIALLSERVGWSFVLLIWLGIAVLGTLICLLCVKPWKLNFSD